MMDIIRLFIILIKSLFTFKSNYKITFYRENNKWYAYIRNWPDKYHANTEMVFGSNKFLSYLANGKDYVILNISTSPKSNSKITLNRVDYTIFGGAFYNVDYKEFKDCIWICPVTLFVLGKYPKTIYINDIWVK